jgi:DNA-binding XRE family transcriptional regulator
MLSLASAETGCPTISYFGICLQPPIASPQEVAVEERGREILLSLLKAIRTEAGLKQAELAERLEVPQSFVSKYENGERRLDLLEIHRLCQETGTTLEEFAARFEAAMGQRPAKHR